MEKSVLGEVKITPFSSTAQVWAEVKNDNSTLWKTKEFHSKDRATSLLIVGSLIFFLTWFSVCIEYSWSQTDNHVAILFCMHDRCSMRMILIIIMLWVWRSILRRGYVTGLSSALTFITTKEFFPLMLSWRQPGPRTTAPAVLVRFPEWHTLKSRAAHSPAHLWSGRILTVVPVYPLSLSQTHSVWKPTLRFEKTHCGWWHSNLGLPAQ